MSTTAKEMIDDLVLAADGEDARESYACVDGVIENGPERAMVTLINMATRERFRVTVQRVP